MAEYPHLAEFKSKEGYWDKRETFRPIINDVYANHQPRKMLEIGFNIGYSASMWLEFDPDNKLHLTSVDIGKHSDTQPAARAVKNLHGDRFEFILSDSKIVYPQLKGQYFDLAFIDGDHSDIGVFNDIELCLKLKIPFLVFDDYHTINDQNPIRNMCEQYQRQNKLSLLKVYDLDIEQPKVAIYRNDSINSKENLLKRQISLLSPRSRKN
jgi:hypothetical protein